MARMRSPNFPSLSLEEAVSFAKVIWDKNRKALIPREAAAKDLGYTGLTGRSMTVLGALNQYGLVEVTAKGQTRVTQLAEDIFIGFPEEVKREAVSNAGRAPTLFREIYDKYDGDIPGENAIRSYLYSRGFTNDGVEKALKSFNATNRYVEIYGVSESYRNEPESAPESAPDQVVQEEKMVTAAAPQPPSSAGQGIDQIFWNKGPLDFNLSSSGLAVVGKTNSAGELKAFIEKLKALTVLLPDKPQESASDETKQ
jgi:hypothetical protein